MQYLQRTRHLLAAPLLLVLMLTSAACSPPAKDRCAGIDCGDNGSCEVVGGAPRCECALGFVQLGSQCVPAPDGGVEGCGNGVAGEGETCDGQDLRGETCIGLGFTDGGNLSCRDTCDHYDTSGCNTYCGDGLAGGTEVCDGSQLNFETCEGLGFYGGQLACDANCEYDAADCFGRCGDGIVNFGPEECDGTNLVLGTCVTEGYYIGTLACGADCQYDTSGCDLECGDGVFQSAYESCEGSELGGETCESLNYNSGILGCTAECEFDTIQCESDCGNGVINADERCDDGNNVDGDGCSADCTFALGRIVFVSDRVVGYDLWTMTDDGTNLAQLTTHAVNLDPCLGAHNPRWSPDGRLVAYRVGGLSQDCVAVPQIWVVSALTGDATFVVQTDIRGGLTWSRTGSHIIYQSEDPSLLRWVTVDGTVDASLFDSTNEEWDPDHHPFLDRLVYSQFSTGGIFPGLFIVDTAGAPLGSPVGMCSSCDLRSARWSSNGARILFRRSGGIFWVSADGTSDGTVMLSDAGMFVDWLTDSQVLYQTPPPNEELAVVDINGSNIQTLTTDGYFYGEPDWHPGQRDSDLDGYLDWEDNCVMVPNDQADTDGDGAGDDCDP